MIKAATLTAPGPCRAEGRQGPAIGTCKAGKLADLVIVPENPLANLKTLYATGHARLNEETNEVERVGSVRWTLKDGIVYDAERLRADVRAMVDEQQAAGERIPRSASEGRPASRRPGRAVSRRRRVRHGGRGGTRFHGRCRPRGHAHPGHRGLSECVGVELRLRACPGRRGVALARRSSRR